MEDGAERIKPKANRKKGRLLMVLSAVIVVGVLATALVFASGLLAPGAEDDPQNSNDGNDTDSDTSEDTLASGIAPDFILNQSDMGADWTASVPVENPEFIDSPQVTSSSYVQFWQLNSSGDLHFRIDIIVMVFDSVDNASSFYDECIEIHPQHDSDINPEYRPSYPVLLTNVSIGDRGAIVDGPQLTMGQGVKWLFFLDKNVVCAVQYRDMTSYDPLPNELLIDLANKVEAKIA